jgi:hypothetical protein
MAQASTSLATVRARRRAGVVGLASIAIAWSLTAENASADEEEDLPHRSENPIARLINVPLQNNFNFGVGPGRDLQYILNLQPVIPTDLSEDWYLIHRFILPITTQPETAVGQGGAFGLGDLQYQLYLSPSPGRPTVFIWGLGPIFSFATATNTLLGSGRSSVGPTGTFRISEGPWLVGVLANQLWSYSANLGTASVSQLLIQPFINFNFPGGWYLASVPIMTANWKAESGQKWTIPVGGGFGKIVELVSLPVNASLQAFWNAAHPDNGPTWQLRAQFQLLFPR